MKIKAKTLKEKSTILIRFVFLFALVTVSLILCSCNFSKVNKEVNSSNSITIHFSTNHGELEFESCELELNNGYTYINEENLPTITNEGDGYIFDYWGDSNGNLFNFNLPLSQNTNLFAYFDEAEYVWSTKWEKYENLAPPSYSFGAGYKSEETGLHDSHSSVNSSNLKNANFIKIKKSDCLDEYITQNEYASLSKTSCFITSSDKEKIVTTADICSDTYLCVYCIYMGSYIRSESGMSMYLPKGTNPLLTTTPRKGFLACLYENSRREIGQVNEYGSAGDGDWKTVCLTYAEMRTYSRETFDDLRSSSYSCPYDFQDGSTMYVISSFSYIKWQNTVDGTRIYNYAIPDSDERMGIIYWRVSYNVSKTDYDSIR